MISSDMKGKWTTQNKTEGPVLINLMWEKEWKEYFNRAMGRREVEVRTEVFTLESQLQIN